MIAMHCGFKIFKMAAKGASGKAGNWNPEQEREQEQEQEPEPEQELQWEDKPT